MKLQMMKVSEIIPYEKNPRNNLKAVGAVAASIKKFGFQVPIVIDKNNVVVAGDTRLKAAKRLEMKEIPCVLADELTEEQVRAFRLADNKTGEIAEWDMNLLKEELSGIDMDMLQFGFDFNFSFMDDEVEEDNFDPNEETSKISEPKTKRGDVWQLGNHLLMCGDSSCEADVLRLAEKESVDLLLTDPPYNVSLGIKSSSTAGRQKQYIHDGQIIQNDDLDDTAFQDLLNNCFKNAEKVLKPGKSFYIWFASKQTESFLKAVKSCELKISETLVWNKNNFVIGRQDYHHKHEPCLYGWKEGGAHSWFGGKNQSTVLDFDRPTASKAHPTMKPISLMAYLIRNSSRKEEIVLDLFGGSGSTLMACEQTSRVSRMMEIDPLYCDVIIKRWEKFTGKMAKQV